MDTEKMTVVFEITDRTAMKAFYDAHKDGLSVCGMQPIIMAWGDQMTVPGEIVDILANLDPESFNKKEIKELCEMAEKHWNP